MRFSAFRRRGRSQFAAADDRLALGSVGKGLQPGVLFSRQPQEYAAAAGGDRLVQHQPLLPICNPTAPLHQLDHLIRRREVQLPGQSSLQVLLQELAVPAISALEVQVHPAAIIVDRGVILG